MGHPQQRTDDPQTEFREAYHRFRAAHDEFMAMMNGVIEGRDDCPVAERVKKARSMQRLLAEFMKAGEPFISPRR